MRCAVVYKNSAILDKVVKFLKENNVEVEVFSTPSRLLEEFDFIVSIGGDGTILSILQEIKRCPPIFGINIGKIGLLTHATPFNFEEQLREAIQKFEVEKFPRLSCSFEGGEFLALNEVVFFGEERAKLSEIVVRIDSIEVDRIRCDGMIVATQIGSTGYAFSAGGPVVDPYLESIVLVPIAPFRFGWKPFVLDGNRVVELESSAGFVVIDGKRTLGAKKVIVRKSNFPAIFFARKDRFKNLFYTIRRIE
ncbi:MAG: NAD(+)/NADH kinase [Archaeoglobaceae archaeon]